MKRKKIFAWLLLVVLLAGALVGLWRRPDVSGPPSMFTDLPAGEAPSSFPEQSIAKRHRWVRLDAPGMHQLALNTGEQKRVILNLFPDLEVEALVMANKTHGNGDQSALGLVNDSQDSLMVMSFHKGVMMGMVVLPDGRQVLVSHVKDDKYAIIEVDPSKVGGCGNCVELSGDTATATGQRKAQAPAGKDKTSAVDNGVWARRMAMADPRVLKETAAECRVYQSGKSPAARMRPLLAAMGAPMPMLAAGNKYGLHGSGGTVRQSMGPTSAHSIHYQRPGNVEYIDVLFIYDSDLLAQEGGAINGLTNIQAKTTRMIDSLNVIYTACAIPLDVRQAGNLVAGRYRAMAGSPAELTGSGYAGPAWEEVQAPVRPNTTATDPKTWTVFNTTGAQPQAKVGVYQPKYENLSDRATKTFGDYLTWISDQIGRAHV